jgi:hypothetical protein
MTERTNLQNILINAVVDGATGAAFFGKLRWLGASESLVDYRVSGDYKAQLQALKDSVESSSTPKPQLQPLAKSKASVESNRHSSPHQSTGIA